MEKLFILIISFSSVVYSQAANRDIKGLQHWLSPPKPVLTNDITSVLLNQIDIMKLTHKETMVHPESLILKDKKELDYIFQWNKSGTVEVYEGNYADASYWFTTKVYRNSSKKVQRIEEIVRDGEDNEGRKKIIASIVNFSGFELQDRTICEGYLEKTKVDQKFKRFMASEDVNKEYPQVILSCHTFNEKMCQQFERISHINKRFEKDGNPYWEKFLPKGDKMNWIEEIMNSHSYQTKQKDNFITLKMDLKPGGKYANFYWPKKLSHHRYSGFVKKSELSEESYDYLQAQCDDHKAYIAPSPEYIRPPRYEDKKSTPNSPSNGGVGGAAGVALN